MFEVHLAKVKQALARHSRVADPLFFRHHLQHRIHQSTLAGGTGRLDQDRQGLIELAAQSGQIDGLNIGRFPHHPTGGNVMNNPIQQVRRLEEGQGRRFFVRGHGRGFRR